MACWRGVCNFIKRQPTLLLEEPVALKDGCYSREAALLGAAEDVCATAESRPMMEMLENLSDQIQFINDQVEHDIENFALARAVSVQLEQDIKTLAFTRAVTDQCTFGIKSVEVEHDIKTVAFTRAVTDQSAFSIKKERELGELSFTLLADAEADQATQSTDDDVHSLQTASEAEACREAETEPTTSPSESLHTAEKESATSPRKCRSGRKATAIRRTKGLQKHLMLFCLKNLMSSSK